MDLVQPPKDGPTGPEPFDSAQGQGRVEGDELKQLEEELENLENPVEEAPTVSVSSQTPPVSTVPPGPPTIPTPVDEPPVPPPPVDASKDSKIVMAAIGLLALALIGIGAYLLGSRGSGQKACTADAKICLDGSSVGRVGPNCEFAPCPTPTPLPSPSPTETPSATPSGTPEATPTAIPSASPSATPLKTPNY